ncbi:MAG: PIG-L family deacetylase [Verrucomicrobiae bacterium]|nr:PIG-L family deacetylase [Verrucomicrobiae bacterium]
MKKTLPSTVLGIGAHPDDLEISCGGTLAKYARQGCRVVMVCMTDGRYGRLHAPEKMIEVRRKETRAAAALLKAELKMMGHSDLGLADNPESRLEMVDIIRETAPDVILTHDPSDLNPDHRVVSKLAYDSLIPCITQTFKTSRPPCKRMPILYYMNTVCGTNFNPEEYVDISETISLKLKMLSMHRSQMETYRRFEKRDMMKFVEAMAVVYGFRCGVQHAEGFRRIPIWTQTSVSRWLP